MTTPTVDGNAVIAEAESHLGEDGSRFQAWAGFSRSDPWCCMFTRFVLATVGADWFPQTAYVPDVVVWAQQNGCWASPSSNPPIGSPVIFDWDADGLADHIGIVTGYDGPYVLTIEGNAGGPDNSTSIVRRWSRGRDLIEGFLAIDSQTQPTDSTGGLFVAGEVTSFSNDALVQMANAIDAGGAANSVKVALSGISADIQHHIDSNSLLEAQGIISAVGKQELSGVKATSDDTARQLTQAKSELTTIIANAIQQYGEGVRAAAIGLKPGEPVA